MSKDSKPAPLYLNNKSLQLLSKISGKSNLALELDPAIYMGF